MELEVTCIPSYSESQGEVQTMVGSLATSIPWYSVLGGLTISKGTPQVGAFLGAVSAPLL